MREAPINSHTNKTQNTKNQNDLNNIMNSMTTSDNSQTFIVPTVFDKQDKVEMDTKNITTSSDLEALKVGDPFLYHSIPAVKEATLNFKEVDMSRLSGPNADSVTQVKRQTRLTTESAPDSKPAAGGGYTRSLFTYNKS